jgi:hypothetical protein
MCQSQNYKDKIMLSKDIRFIYNLYKNFFIYYFAKDINKTTIVLAHNLSTVIILQGPLFVNNLVNLECNGNIVSITSKFKNSSEMFEYILKHYNRYVATYPLELLKFTILFKN